MIYSDRRGRVEVGGGVEDRKVGDGVADVARSVGPVMAGVLDTDVVNLTKRWLPLARADVFV